MERGRYGKIKYGFEVGVLVRRSSLNAPHPGKSTRKSNNSSAVAHGNLEVRRARNHGYG